MRTCVHLHCLCVCALLRTDMVALSFLAATKGTHQPCRIVFVVRSFVRPFCPFWQGMFRVVLCVCVLFVSCGFS